MRVKPSRNLIIYLSWEDDIFLIKLNQKVKLELGKN